MVLVHELVVVQVRVIRREEEDAREKKLVVDTVAL
jgi:hypothetical protein